MQAELIAWLPFPDFYQSIHCLDDYTAGRTMFESGVILDHLVGTGHERLWQRHAATRMWHGYHSALGLYHSLCIREWYMRGHKPMRTAPYDWCHGYTTKTLHYACNKFVPLNEIEFPSWLGDEGIHAIHRAELLRIKPEHYGKFGWSANPIMELTANGTGTVVPFETGISLAEVKLLL